MSWQDAGFYNERTNVTSAMHRLGHYIDAVADAYRQYNKEELLQKPSPGKWSKQEVLGHLVDSALNNLKRFTEIQFQPQPYQIISYQQDEWVEVNHYQLLKLTALLQLWQSLNRQIIHVVQHIPAEKMQYAVNPQYQNNEVKTLGWIICDYVAHMEHHLPFLKHL